MVQLLFLRVWGGWSGVCEVRRDDRCGAPDSGDRFGSPSPSAVHPMCVTYSVGSAPTRDRKRHMLSVGRKGRIEGIKYG